MADEWPQAVRDASGFLAAVERANGGPVVLPSTADNEAVMDRAQTLARLAGVQGVMALMSCHGRDLDHGEGEGCLACDAERAARAGQPLVGRPAWTEKPEDAPEPEADMPPGWPEAANDA